MEDRIKAESERIRVALQDPETPADKYCQLYAANQALQWALSADLAASPFEVIDSGRVQPLIHG